MSKIKLEVEVSKEAHELAQAVKGVVAAAKKHLADGFQAGTDLPAVFAESLGPLMTGVAGVEQLPAEVKEDMKAFLDAWMLAGTEIAAMFIKVEDKPAEVAPEVAPSPA